MHNAKLNIKNTEILNNTICPHAALRFVTLLDREYTDYIEISSRFYENQTIDEIFERARMNWIKDNHYHEYESDKSK